MHSTRALAANAWSYLKGGEPRLALEEEGHEAPEARQPVGADQQHAEQLDHLDLGVSELEPVHEEVLRDAADDAPRLEDACQLEHAEQPNHAQRLRRLRTQR